MIYLFPYIYYKGTLCSKKSQPNHSFLSLEELNHPPFILRRTESTNHPSIPVKLVSQSL